MTCPRRPSHCLLRASQGVEVVHRLLNRSTIILMRACNFALASTDQSVDAISASLLCSPALPLLSPTSFAYLLDALADQHGSTTAFVRMLHWLLLRHFRAAPLCFLCPCTQLADNA